MLAIFQPHITEDVYQEHFRAIDGNRSIHLTSWPEPIFTDEDAEKEGAALSEVLAAIRAWKSERKIALNAEISMIEFVGKEAKLLESSKTDISETTKAKDVRIAPEADLTEEIVAIKPLHKVLGPAFKADAKAIVSAVAAMDVADVAKMYQAGAIEVEVNGSKMSVDSKYFEAEKRLMLDGKAVETVQVGNILILIEL